MRRREVITLLGSAVAWPIPIRAQQPMPVIGFLNSASAQGYAPYVGAFRQALQQAGYTEGHNLEIEYRWAEGRYERLPTLAADLIRRKVMLIFATGGIASALAAKTASSAVPIVFVNGSDPVKLGLVSSLNRPTGNATGVIFFALALTAKRVELLKEFVPEAERIGFLANGSNPNTDYQLSDARAAVQSIGRMAEIFVASNRGEITTAFARLAEQHIRAVAVLTDPLFVSSGDHIATLAAEHRVAAIASWREFPASGGLVSYGPSMKEAYQQAAAYVIRILSGSRPADLPIQQSTKFELVINLKTAKALSIEVPPALLGTADEVIE
jgi:putative ABC transport system substrate-binding protein